MKKSNLKIGDRVYLASHTYTSSNFNPTKGSSYECKGTICEISSKGTITRYTVRWDNGITNYYISKDDLMLSSLSHNNYKSIW